MTDAQHADVIVIGLGGMGSAAAAHVAMRGHSVIGIEQLSPNHDQGSSHGETRIIRRAYFESPDYVPLLQRAYILWRELEQLSGSELMTITGGLNIGTIESGFVSGSLRSASEHGLAVEQLEAADVNRRFPGYHLPDNLVALFDPAAGFLRPEQCLRAHLDLAEKHGAHLVYGTPVIDWDASESAVTVETGSAKFSAERLIITAGPWSANVIKDWHAPLEVWRIPNVHFDSTAPERFSPDRCPVFLLEVPEGHYYGFPALPGQGVKIGRHDIGEVCTPDTINRQVGADEIQMLRQVLDTYLPGASGPVNRTLTCMYTNTPDTHFVLDHHPAMPNVVVGCGFSGHGFKFASAIGETLAALALDGVSSFDLDFLSAARFGGTA